MSHTITGIFRIDCGPADRMISAIYECLHDGEIRPDRHEIAGIELRTAPELKEMLKSDRFAPWTREILRYYFHQPSEIQPF